MSTPEQHQALFLEILAEMTPRQLAELLLEAGKPLKLEPIDFELPQEPAFLGRRLDLFYGHAVVINPYRVNPAV